MTQRPRRLPSPALVVSVIALFVSLSGVSYGLARGVIGSREIKDNEIRSRDIRNNEIRSIDIRNNEVRGRDIRNSTIRGRDVAINTLTGEDINESTLGKVASAATADNATSAASAASAETVGGLSVTKLFVKQTVGTTPTEVQSGPGYVLEAGCTPTGAILRLHGASGAPKTNVTLHGNGQGGGGAFSDSDTNLEPSDQLDLLGGNDRGAGTAVVSTTSGAVTTLVYALESSPAFEGEAVCALRGVTLSG